jgi:hypothetical protein
MNIRKQLLAGNNRFNVDLVMHHIGADEELFAELVDMAHCRELPLSHRAAWALTACCDQYPYLIIPHLKTIVKGFASHMHPGITRCMVRALCLIDLPEKYAGPMYNICQQYIEDPDVPIAIRVFAMQLMYNISEQEPELKPELALFFESVLEADNNSGVTNRGGKLLHKLKRPTKKTIR